MITTNYERTYYLSTDCGCTFFDEDAGEYVDATECFGCYTDDEDTILHELTRWITRNEVEAVAVQCSSMTWRNVPARALMNAQAVQLLGAMTIRGDYRLEFYWDAEDNLTARRWSHDEPTGTGLFTFTPVPYSEFDK